MRNAALVALGFLTSIIVPALVLGMFQTQTGPDVSIQVVDDTYSRALNILFIKLGALMSIGPAVICFFFRHLRCFFCAHAGAADACYPRWFW